jgi:anti-sigma28 factor (negative regulator of flagellin synthesis)
MRIDDVNSGTASSEASKAAAVKPDRAEGASVSRREHASDAADISGLAAALSPNEARLEALQIQVERGEYRPSAKDVAARIIDQHTKEA